MDEKKKDLAAKKRKTLGAAITYFENNQDHMHYDEYLAAGHPITPHILGDQHRSSRIDRLGGNGNTPEVWDLDITPPPARLGWALRFETSQFDPFLLRRYASA
ncbi:MAG: hypothetical protein MUF25_00845 [Pirellulaceae bacterium]|nr:hypothetical protein [Pirellulaceae bacterium]